jgi:hypothetical protein
MKTIAMLFGAFVLGAVTLGAVGPVAMHNFGGTCPVGPRWCLGTVSVVKQLTGSEGGPQALEGYTIVETRAAVRLAHGTIGNIEQAGSGDLIEARPLQSGGILTGQGRVARWVGLFIDKPKEARAGQLQDFRAIQFDNGLYLTTGMDGDGKPYLALCPNLATTGPCQVFKP